MEILRVLDWLVKAFRVASVLVLVVVAYSGIVLMQDAQAAFSQVQRGEVETLTLTNRGYLPLTLTILVEIEVDGHKASIVREYHIPPGGTADLSLGLEELYEKLPADALSSAAFRSVKAQVKATVNANIGGLVQLSAASSRELPIGPLIKHYKMEVVGVRPLNMTHALVKMRMEINAPMLAGVEGRVRLTFDGASTGWTSFKVDEAGNMELEKEVVVRLGARECLIELCLGGFCHKEIVSVGGWP